MPTKAQLIDYIIDVFEQPDHTPILRSKLDGYKKAELESFIGAKSSLGEVGEWLNNK